MLRVLAGRCVALTWDVVSFVLDVHLVEASLGGLELDSDGAVLIIRDVWTGGFA